MAPDLFNLHLSPVLLDNICLYADDIQLVCILLTMCRIDHVSVKINSLAPY